MFIQQHNSPRNAMANLAHYGINDDPFQQAYGASRGPSLVDLLTLNSKGRYRHNKRKKLFAATYAKLEVRHTDTYTLDTCHATLPAEIVDLIAAYMHPRDVARLRPVSTGWRSTLWQEKVVRSSLRGLGDVVDFSMMFKIISSLGCSLKPLFEYSGDRVCWRHLLDQFDWAASVKTTTENTVVGICVAMVPLGDVNAEAQFFALKELPRSVRKRGAGVAPMAARAKVMRMG